MSSSALTIGIGNHLFRKDYKLRKRVRIMKLIGKPVVTTHTEIEWNTDNTCCTEIRGALNLARCMEVLEGGKLHLKIGIENDHGEFDKFYYDQPVKFCPFCGEKIEVKHEKA